jgi:hypothetical protein
MDPPRSFDFAAHLPRRALFLGFQLSAGAERSLSMAMSINARTFLSPRA